MSDKFGEAHQHWPTTLALQNNCDATIFETIAPNIALLGKQPKNTKLSGKALGGTLL
jgi:hypothetical protein